MAVSSNTGRAVARMLHAFPAQCAAASALFWAYHVALSSWLSATGKNLGAVDAGKVAPLHASWEQRLPGLWVIPAIGVLGAFILLSDWLYLRPKRPARVLLAASVGFFFAIGLSVSMIDGFRQAGPRAPRTYAPFLFPYTKTSLEYFGDVPTVERMGLRAFLGRFAQPGFSQQLALHTRTHPPGGVVFLWLVSRVFGYSLWSGCLATIAFTALSVPLLYAAARELYGESAARRALGLFLVVPNYVMFTTTSMDGPFSVFGVLTLYLFLRGSRDGGPRWWWLPTGLALFVGSFMTYALPAFLAVFFALWLALTWISERVLALRMLRTLFLSALVLAAGYLCLAVWARYDPVAAVRNSIQYDAQLMGSRNETWADYFNLSSANLAGFLIGIGVPLVVLCLRRLAAALAEAHSGQRLDCFLFATVSAVVLLGFSTLFTMELERIWLFIVPFLSIAAGRQLVGAWGEGLFRWALVLSSLQLVVFEAFLFTGW